MPESCHSESTWKFKNSTLFSIEGKEGFLFFAEIYLLFSCSVMSDSLRPRGLQHARLPCPSPSPRVCWNSHSLGWWCPPSIWSSVTLLLLPSPAWNQGSLESLCMYLLCLLSPEVKRKSLGKFSTKLGVSVDFFFFLTFFGCTGSQGQHMGSSSLTRDRSLVPCTGSSESWLLGHRRSPSVDSF